MPSYELDDEFLNLFFNITNASVPSNITLNDFKKQLIDIVDTMKELNKNAKKPFKSIALGNYEEENTDNSKPSILIVDDLGVITYQLRVQLSKFEVDIDCSQEIYDAVNKYKKRKHNYVIMDLFIPTEREGFILLTELKKLATMNANPTTIGVITASSRKDIEQQCRLRGADFFLEKNNDWQKNLLNIIDSYINKNKNEDDEDDVELY